MVDVALAGAAIVAALTVWQAPAGPPLPPRSAAHPDPVTPRPVRALPPARPVRLEIPEIGVRTPLVTLAKNSDGTIEVPARADRAGWYRPGPAPGSTGPAVIVGHVDSRRGPAVFHRLGDLRPGNTVRVVRAGGSVAVFRIDSVERVSKDRFPTQRVYGPLPYPGLRLITCGGRFDSGDGRYVDNIIAYAHLV
ncbi:class F sortase [Actinomadura craniellae]|uniref:Class F sortase n=2 Tax=Actinomadura craniellae TaxID=2231787 RepID=A0A365GWV3_9ACTN|nr:class F sortase [Actinomadura craniellae]